MLLRLLIALLPALALLALIIVPLILYRAYLRGEFSPKTMMIQHPASGNYTRIELDDIQRVEIEDDEDSTLYYKDGTRMTIKTKDAKKLLRLMPTLNPTE